MKDDKTCGDCPWWRPDDVKSFARLQKGHGNCYNMLDDCDPGFYVQVHSISPECPSRKAFRVLRDEVRRLREELYHANQTLFYKS